MSDFIVMAAVSSLVAASIVGGAYLKFGRGLATRVFGTVIPLCVMVVMIGFYVGTHGVTLRAIVPSFSFGVVACTVWLLVVCRSVVGRLAAQVDVLATSTAQIASTARQCAVTAAQQAAAVDEISATIEELQRTSAATAAAAKHVSTTAVEASRRGHEGIEASARAKQVLTLIAQVGDLVDSIRNFADQSNLLAINAGIEAAKAGDQGRGFGVVAAEVRDLAEQSKRAAQRIHASVSGAEAGRRAIEEVDAALARLAKTVDDSTDRIDQIAATAAQEAIGVRQIAQAMTTVSEGGQVSAATARQLEGAVRSVEQVAEDLRRFVAG